MVDRGEARRRHDSERLLRLAALLRLYVITDRGLARGRSEKDVVLQAIDGGATAIQLRGKEMSGLEMYRTAVMLRDITADHDIMFVVNDRLDVALAVEADGVHLGQEDIPARAAAEMIARCGAGARRRGAWRGRMALGISAADPGEAKAAEADGADYIGAGPVWATATKPDAGAPAGAGMIEAICSSVGIPVVAIGGISAENAGLLAGTGVAGVAVISAVVAAPDVLRYLQAHVRLSRRNDVA